MQIGVVGLQGAVSEHIDMLGRIGTRGVWVRDKGALKKISGLIIPGGESTTISRLLMQSGMFDRIREMGEEGFPIFGTCAGLILLAKKGDGDVKKSGQKLLGLMNMEVRRNAFGRQRESFEEDIKIRGIGRFPCVFIRAPAIVKVGGKCKPLAAYKRFIVAARQDNLFATAFHPELTQDTRVHRYFLEFAEGKG
jgi:5'-phosphate synthase pdxT subunit